MEPVKTAPRPTRPARLAPLAKLPIFLGLAGRRAVVVGGGAPAAWKAELLAAAGASVAVFAPDPDPELLALAAATPALVLHRRPWRPGDLDQAALVVAEEGCGQAVDELRAVAKARGILTNVIDAPDLCDFQFGTIVNRSPVVIGIMTDGAAPILGQAIRRRVEVILPPGIGGWAETAKGVRARLGTLLPARADRRRFWERFVNVTFTSQANENERLAAVEQLAAEIAADDSEPSRTGEVVIVGAGPGDPELLTLKAMRELQAADVIVYDRLVTPEVLELGRREARRIHVGKEGHGASCRQEDISALLVDLALAGERVVRLKGGDPSVFGRSGEEIAACREAGVPVRVVPGITSASAAAAALTLSLTHREHAQKIQFVTGHDRHGDLPSDLDFGALADPRSTLVVYMGRRSAAQLAARLLAKGLAGTTPVVAVTDVSRPAGTVARTDLTGLLDALPLPEARPLLILIGRALEVGSLAGASVQKDERVHRTTRRALTQPAAPSIAEPAS